MIEELRKLRELTETLTGNGYLRDHTKEWEYALDAIPECICIINSRYKISFANKALIDRLNQSRSELIGKDYYEEIRGIEVNSESLNSTPIPKSVKSVFLSKLNGWFDISKSPIYTSSEKLIGFICVLQDVTDKRSAINEIINKKATLDVILDTVPVGIGLMDKNKNILSINKSMEKLLGYSDMELRGKPIGKICNNEEDFNKVCHILDGNNAFNTCVSTKDGNVINILLKIATVGPEGLTVFTISNSDKMMPCFACYKSI